MAEKYDKCVPKLRFPEFKNNGEWEVKELRDLSVKITDKNNRNLDLPVLTNSATEGVIKQTDYFEREIVTKENLCNYYVVEADDFVYNPRISSTAPVGPVSRNKGGRGLLSPLYTVFRFKKGHLDFYEQFFKTNSWQYYLKKKANYGARFDRINISSEDFFSMPLPVPSFKEQKAIALCLTSLDVCISASKAKLEQLKAHKKGLMQKLFPAPGKTLPEYRFPEYIERGNWKAIKLKQVIKVNSGRDYKHLQRGSIPVYGTGGYMLSVNEMLSDKDAVGIGRKGTIDKPQYLTAPFWTVDTLFYLTCEDGVDTLFFFYLSQLIPWKKYGEQTGVPSLSKNSIEELEVPIPEYPEQCKIASLLNSIDAIIQKQVIELECINDFKQGLLQVLMC